MKKRKEIRKCRTIGCDNVAEREGYCIDCHNELDAMSKM
jgi:hypothetical protein